MRAKAGGGGEAVALGEHALPDAEDEGREGRSERGEGEGTPR